MGTDWQIINCYIAIIAIIASVAASTIPYLKQIKKKKLTFHGIQNLSPENINDELKDELAVKYPGRSGLFLLTANICNAGDLSIRDYDIITPIKISFPEKIIGCNVVKEKPEGINVHLIINYDENSVECNFKLLNVSDYFTLEFVSLEKLSIPTVLVRIDNLSGIDTSYFDLNYSSMNPLTRSIKKVFRVLKDTKFNKPIVTFTIPGIILLISSLYLGIRFLQDFTMGASLYFGPTVLMFMLFIGGMFMVLLGLLTHLVISNYKPYTKVSKLNVVVVVLGSLLVIGSLYMGSRFLQVFLIGGDIHFGPTILMVLLFIGGVFMILIGLTMHLAFSNRKS